MSFLGRLTQGFCALGGIGTFPFFAGVNPFKAQEKMVPPPPKEVKPEPQVSSPMAEIIRQEKYEGCIPLGRGRYISLYACLKTVNDGTSQSLFYYVDRTRSVLSLQERVKPIAGITYNNSNSATLKLKDQSSKNLQLPPFWMNKWKDKGEVNPESVCKFSLEQDKRNSYFFTCSDEKPIEKGINF